MNESNLHDYQRATVAHILDNPKAGVFLDMGLGKTVSTLTAVQKLLFEELAVSRVLVIAPKRVTESVWTAEARKWEHLAGLKLSRVIGTEKQRIAALAAPAHIYLVSRDNVAWLCGRFGGTKLPFDMLVIDESSSFKNHQSQRFKALKAALASFSRVVILTGTPAPNGLIDIWAQIYMLDRGERLGKLIGKFREEHFRPNARNGDIVYSYKIKEGAEQAIHDKIADICVSMKAADYLALPARVNNYIETPLGDDVAKLYRDFEREQIMALLAGEGPDETTITAASAAALSNKLLQFAGGAVYDNEKGVVEVHGAKIAELAEIVEQAGGKPVLVAWNYRHEADRIHRALAKYAPRALKTDADIQDWNAGKIRVMTMHPASGGHGLNLQAGGNIIAWFSPTWSLELYQQFNARLDRQGQTEAVIVHHLVAPGTIDTDVLAALDDKTGTQEHLMRSLKARIEDVRKHARK